MRILVYIEGGTGNRASTELRRGFNEFFRRAVPVGTQVQPVPGGSRSQTYDQFRIAVTKGIGDLVLLLVDSERPVPADASPWSFLKASDGWDQPSGATDDQAHLMVQCMEAWFLADKEALARYYGQGFLPNALPRRRNVEEVPKAEIFTRLERATSQTRTKGGYRKVKHSGALLALIDPDRVCDASRHAKRLIEVLLRASQ